MKILLTNDDSHRSPLLELIIRKLEEIGEVTVVVPLHEQSWKGKSMTRFGSVRLGETLIGQKKAYTVDGTPADCVNLGVHHILSEKPDVVVSGVNAGLNTGTSFILCSGTVGACFEANIVGIPAIAFSQDFDTATRNEYAEEYSLPPLIQERLMEQEGRVFDALLPRLLQKKVLNPETTWNVNLPFFLAPEWELEVTHLGRIKYGNFFGKDDFGFSHALLDVQTDLSPGTDSAAIKRGNVSVTPLRPHTFGQIGDQERVALSNLLRPIDIG